MMRRRMPRPQTFRTGTVPVPVEGIDTISSLTEMGKQRAISLVNMIRAEGGLRSRTGYAAWVDNINAGAEVRSILPYLGSAAGGAQDKLFSCTTAGIYDVTDTGTAPAQSIAFATSNALSGYGESQVFVTAAGRFLLYTDEANGYYVWPEGGPWAAVTQGVGATQVNNVNPNTFAWCLSFKNRVWFVEKASTRAWYLPLNSIYGAASQFDFGQQFQAGGQLVGLYSFTLDGGSGMDDLLVAVSSAGDLVIYGGSDPASVATFGIVGRWNVGGVPAGRRLASKNTGGELFILTHYGLIPCSKLVKGRDVLAADVAATDNIRSLFNVTMNDKASLTGWSVVADPQDSSILITYPSFVGEERQQFAMAQAGLGWSQYVGKPILTAKIFNRVMYFGTTDGRVMKSTGYIDNVARDGSTALAKAISWSGQTAFSDLGAAEIKQLQLLIARFVTQGASPAIIMQARYDFDQTPITLSPPTPALPANAWDGVSPPTLWDSAVFAGATAPYKSIQGAYGIGTHVSIAWVGSSIQRMSLIAFNVAVSKGGLL